MSGFRHLGDEELLELARVRVCRGTFEAPDGSRFERDIIRNEDVVAVVPLHDDGTVTLVRQYRGPIDRELVEIPAGLCDQAGESYEDAARRELVEEVGLVAEHLELVASYFASAGFSDQFVRLYVATGLREVETAREGPEEQAMTVERVALDAVPELIASGGLSDAKTLIGLLSVRDRSHHD